MKRILVLIIATMLWSSFSAPILLHRFIVQPESTLVVTGKTNVNSFQCTTLYCGRDTLVLRESVGSAPVFIKGNVQLDASAFSCGMQLITNDFNKTIKAKEHPAIAIDFISFERTPVYGCAEERFKGRMKISLAGITKTFDVVCAIETSSTGIIYLRGNRAFTFADFNLTAPSRMMGMVKVEDKLEVKFNLALKLDPNR
ncbi:MAG: YceI family protein [Cyclobacteriaceae bacterium]|nr:YceI family protein [Cyclobacteriaceae bacterium]